MRRAATAAMILLGSFFSVSSSRAAEDTWDYSVRVDSVVEAAPAKITLNWPQDTNRVPVSYIVYRKAPGAREWGSGTTLPGSATTYADTTVENARAYEYRIVKIADGYTGYGYIQTGINLPLVDRRGAVVLIVDKTCAESLPLELDRLEEDLVGDGWTVRRHDVGRTDSVTSVKELIKADYEADPVNVKSVFLFGHVPVPYSGKMNPDDHPDHIGAWPADVYYGDMHGEWTDRAVNYRQTLNADAVDAARLTNIPGDGKFDQSTIPGTVELEVGRVDLANMPGRASTSSSPTFQSETQLLRQYLNKDHNFRHRLLNVQRRAIVGDYFGVRGGEAFSASGYRSFAPLVGTQNVADLNVPAGEATTRWIPMLAAHDYLLAYGCGPGSYQTIDGLGNGGPAHDGHTVDIVNNDIQAVFTLIFGSWLGDWDHEDDIMRAILAAPTCSLATAWSGRPHWFVHAMGVGETIGYTARLTQNNTGLYQNQVNASVNQVHIALMGDPTLRLHPVAPVSGLGGANTSHSTVLTWTPSPDRVVGYHVYRASSANAAYARLTDTPVSNPSFVDRESMMGATYMVRAVKLESTPSGTYFNASQGLFWTAGDNLARTRGRSLPHVAMLATHASGSGKAALGRQATPETPPLLR